MAFVKKSFTNYIPKTKDGYVLPISGEPHISQGYNGRYSHANLEFENFSGKTFFHDDRHSLDFAVPIGTSVHAAKEGKVYSVVDCLDQFYQGTDINVGVRIFTNHLFLKHDDGSFTLYSHLKKNSARYEKGSEVKQGEVIAQTGNSGWVGPVPHLHFSAMFLEGGGLHRRSFPVVFSDYNGVLEQAEIEITNNLENILVT